MGQIDIGMTIEARVEARVAMVEIVLNGAPHQVPPAHTLFDLVDGLALANQALALAVNRSVVRRQDWPKQVLVYGDQVDIVRAIGGG
jgi:sulfur carrier protein